MAKRTHYGIGDGDTAHGVVDHVQHECVRGIVQTNTMESVWSLFKRSIVGSYLQISVRHLDRYLDELESRFNNRHNPFLFRDTLLRLLASSNIEYKELTKDKAALRHDSENPFRNHQLKKEPFIYCNSS